MNCRSYFLAILLVFAGGHTLHAAPVAEGGCPVRWQAVFGGTDRIRAYQDEPTANWKALRLVAVQPAGTEIWIQVEHSADPHDVELDHMQLDKLYILKGMRMTLGMPKAQTSTLRQATFCVDQPFARTLKWLN